MQRWCYSHLHHSLSISLHTACDFSLVQFLCINVLLPVYINEYNNDLRHIMGEVLEDSVV